MLIRLRMVAAFVYTASLFAQLDETGYSGPSVLSRGLLPGVTTAGKSIRIRPSLSIGGFCDTSLTAFSVDATGKIPNETTCGVEASAAVRGYRRWKQTLVGLDYNGSYRHYPRNKYFDGTDQALSLGISHQATKRTSITLKELAGTYSRNYFVGNGSGFFDSNALYAPTSEVFDNRVYYVLTGADVTYQKSTRLSFNVGGSGYLIRRRSSSLYGMTGASVRGDLAYRFSRFGTIGIAYTFTHFEFTKAFGATDFHSVGVLYSHRLSRTWELGAEIGAARVESLALQTVAVDPVVAAITGQQAGVVASYRLNYIPDGAVRLAKHFRNANFTMEYGRSITPGNGFYLTSAQDLGTVSYAYTGVRHWHFAAMGGYNRMLGLLQTLQDYKSYYAGAGITRDIKGGIQIVLRVDERRYDIGTFQRNGSRGSVGIAWSPGDVPLSLW